MPAAGKAGQRACRAAYGHSPCAVWAIRLTTLIHMGDSSRPKATENPAVQGHQQPIAPVLRCNPDLRKLPLCANAVCLNRKTI